MNLLLFGYKKSGKSYYGLKVANKMHMNFLDTDLLVEELYLKKHHKSLTCKQIVLHHGRRVFQELEKEVIFGLDEMENTVIALGGSTVLDEMNVLHLKKIGTLVYLKTDKKTIMERILRGELPSYIDPKDPITSFEKMYQERLPIYEKIGSLIIDAGHKTEEQITNLLCQHVESARGSHGK